MRIRRSDAHLGDEQFSLHSVLNSLRVSPPAITNTVLRVLIYIHSCLKSDATALIASERTALTTIGHVAKGYCLKGARDDTRVSVCVATRARSG